MCVVKWPSAMKSASAACTISWPGRCKSYSALLKAAISDRHHHVADFDAGEKHLREGAHVDHAFIGVESLQRRQRPAGVAEFAVVVVLQYPGVFAHRHLQ